MKLLYPLIILFTFSFAEEGKIWNLFKTSGHLTFSTSNEWGLTMESKLVMDYLMKNQNQSNIAMLVKYSYSDNSGSYEDYTETMGSVNYHNDREDGDIVNTNTWGLGLGKVFSNSNEIGYILGIGIASRTSTHYQSLYDPYEILGNNGKYFIDPKKPDTSEMGMFFDVTILTKSSMSYGFSYLNVGEHQFVIKIGGFGY
tara:strand:- start:58 stop:654 length:597 start_codon:yes stop_codon:yes gene_type:complete